MSEGLQYVIVVERIPLDVVLQKVWPQGGISVGLGSQNGKVRIQILLQLVQHQGEGSPDYRAPTWTGLPLAGLHELAKLG